LTVELGRNRRSVLCREFGPQSGPTSEVEAEIQ